MIHLVTFSTDDMNRAKDVCVESAINHGVEKALWFGSHFTKFILGWKDVAPRGFGYWAWKPAIIAKTMQRMSDGDILIYSDAGVEFINNVRYIIDRMDQDIFLFGNNWEHAHWCKRDIVECVYAGNGSTMRPSWSAFGKQVQASVIFFRVSDYTRKFVKEWLDWCLFEGGRLIDDSPSMTPNHPEFQENRHDQAILTTMAYREGLRLHYWPAVYLPDDRVYEKLDCYGTDQYPPLFRHHRRRNHEWENAA